MAGRLNARLAKLEVAKAGKGQFLVTCVFGGQTWEQAFSTHNPGETAGPRDVCSNVWCHGHKRMDFPHVWLVEGAP